MDFTKICRIGSNPDTGALFVTINMKGGRLSITGVEGPKANGNCRGSSGQCVDALGEVTDFAPGWNPESAGKLKAIWERWHLNDMRAGSTAQEVWLRANPVAAVYPESHYVKASEALAAAGLNPDADGYKYSSAWKREEVPISVVAWLTGLPDADRAHPWGVMLP